jgi:hypothetical protein
VGSAAADGARGVIQRQTAAVVERGFGGWELAAAAAVQVGERDLLAITLAQ